MPSPASDLEIAPLGAGEAITAFTCRDADLDDFLASDAHRLQRGHAVQTYLARGVETGADVLGFVSLMADAVKLQTKERKGLDLLKSDHPVVPALKNALSACARTCNGAAGSGRPSCGSRFSKRRTLPKAPGAVC